MNRRGRCETLAPSHVYRASRSCLILYWRSKMLVMRERLLIATACAALVVTGLIWLVQWLRGVRARAALRGYGCFVSGSFTGWCVTITPRTTGTILHDVGHALLVLRAARVCLVDLSDDDLRQLEPYLLALEKLWLEVKSKDVTDGGLKYLKSLKTVYFLDVRDTSVTRNGWLNELRDIPCSRVPGRREWYTSHASEES